MNLARAEQIIREKLPLVVARDVQVSEMRRNSLMAFTQYTKSDYKAATHHRLVASYLEEVERGEINRLMIFMPPRHGKLMAHDTPVLTSKGWTIHGALEPGDSVFHPSGQQTIIIAVDKEGWADNRVEFTNGEVVYCHNLHEWTIFDRVYKRWKTLETCDFTKQTKFSKGKIVWCDRALYQLPLIHPIECEGRELPVDPYVLGVWLGDGSASKACVTHSIEDRAVIREVERRGYPISCQHIHSETGCASTYFGGKKGVGGKLWNGLKSIGVTNNKHIPEVYKQGNISQRLELIAGLIDTDGHVDENSRIRIVTASYKLANDIHEVLMSLGCRPYITSQEPHTSSSGIVGKQIVFTIGYQPVIDFPTKLERKKITRIITQRRIGIKSVTFDPQRYKGQCIQVASPDGLYLIGRNLIPTHNSELTSRRFPAWYLGRNPKKQIIAASYNSDLAMDFGRDVRNLVNDSLFTDVFPNVALRADSKAADRWNTANGGAYISAGVGSGITGRGANLGLIDDPFKDRKEANSQTIRDNVWDWYRSTFYTRLMPGAAIVLTVTRWHEDDLAGRLIKAQKEGGDQWVIIDLPALATGVDVLDREEGEPLWPEWYPLQTLLKIKTTIGNYEWTSLYQQSPETEEGNIFKRHWWQYYREVPDKYDFILQSWDTAFKKGAENDYSVCTTWGLFRNMIHLIDRWKDRVDFPELERALETQAVRHNPDAILVEDKASGQSLVQTIKQKSLRPIVAYKPDRDKEARAHAVTPLIEGGRVYLPEWGSWVSDYISCMALFPSGAHDDDVDSTAQALLYLRDRVVDSDAYDDDEYDNYDNHSYQQGQSPVTGY